MATRHRQLCFGLIPTIQPKFLNTGSVQHVRPEALKQLVPIYYASLQDAPMDQYYSVFNHENLRVHYLEKKGV